MTGHIGHEASERRTDLVPGQMHCARCKFQLTRTTLYLGNGTVGAGDSKTEPCPNGCGPLWPVTWEQAAREAWATCETMFERAKAAEDALAAVNPPRLVGSPSTPEAVMTLEAPSVGQVEAATTRHPQYAALMKLSQFAHTSAHMSERDASNNLLSIADQLIALAAIGTPECAAEPERERSCAHGCNGCENCTDYEDDRPTSQAIEAPVDGQGAPHPQRLISALRMALPVVCSDGQAWQADEIRAAISEAEGGALAKPAPVQQEAAEPRVFGVFNRCRGKDDFLLWAENVPDGEYLLVRLADLAQPAPVQAGAQQAVADMCERKYPSSPQSSILSRAAPTQAGAGDAKGGA